MKNLKREVSFLMPPMIPTLGIGSNEMPMQLINAEFVFGLSLKTEKSYDSQVDLDDWTEIRPDNGEMGDECEIPPIDCEYIEQDCTAEMVKDRVRNLSPFRRVLSFN